MTELHFIPLLDIDVSPNRMRRLRPEVVDDLAESIRANGLIHPITVCRGEGRRLRLVAGRHRLAAVQKLAIPMIAATTVDDGDAAQLAEIDENLIRADLSPAERTIHLAERKRLYLKQHPETESVRVRGGPGRRKKNESRPATGKAPAFIEDTAKKTGKHRATIAREVARAKISGITDVVGTSLDEGEELDMLAKLPEPVQRDLIARAKAGEQVTAKHIAKKLGREARERELAAATEAASHALGTKVYGVIYADPPWKFQVYAESGMDLLADNHYPTMTTEAIKTLPVPAADNCVLFLWATVPMLPDAHEVMSAWGFTYKSLLVWVKDRAGLGFWVRNRVELLLIGTRGHVPAPAPGEQPHQVVEAPRGRHSEKPACFAEIIARLFPSTPKVELFARTARPGWDVWGNEVPAEAAE